MDNNIDADLGLPQDPENREYVTEGWQSREADSESFVASSGAEMIGVIVVLILLAVLYQKYCKATPGGGGGSQYTPVSRTGDEDLELGDMPQRRSEQERRSEQQDIDDLLEQLDNEDDAK
jgi:hypothetical protein